MSEIPQNKIEGFKELTEEEINSSSVFSKPQNTSKPPKPKKQLGVMWRTIIALVVVAALVAAIIFISKKFIKKKNPTATESIASTVVSSEDITSKIEESATIKITENEMSEVKYVTLENKNTNIKFYSVKNEAEEYDWYIEGIGKEYIDLESTSLTVGDCATPVALLKREISETEDYGFNNPDAEILVELKNGKTYTLTVGKKFESGGISGAYLKYSEDSKNVYVLSGESADYFTQETIYYIQNYAPTKIETDSSEYTSILGFDYVELNGKNLGEGFRFEMEKRENNTIDYLLTRPYNYPVKGDKMSIVTEVVADNLETRDVFYFNRDGIPEKVLKEYSLDKPDFVLEYKAGNQKKVIKLATSKENDIYYAMTVNDGPCIYNVTARSFEFLEQDYSYFVNHYVLLENISGISKLNYKIGKKEYVFNLSTKEVEGENVTTVKYDGKTIDTEIFSSYYAYLLIVNPIVSKATLLHERPENATEYFSVTISHAKGIPDSDRVFTVYKIKNETRRYYIELDGTPLGLCETEAADMVYNSIGNVISNKEIAAQN